MALVFDSRAIESNWYALPVFRRLLLLLNKDSNHSVLVGDYMGANEHQSLLFTAMNDAVPFAREVDFEHSSQFFVVYINNLTEAMVDHFHDGMRAWEGYVGYADTTYASPFKTLLSTMMANAFLKCRKFIIQGHEDDRPNTENVNSCGYPFEEFGFKCVSIQSYLEGTLLSYKIERPAFSGFESDTEFSLNAISETTLLLDGFTVEIEDAKLSYLKTEKIGSLAKAGLVDTTATQLAELIQSKICSSYI